MNMRISRAFALTALLAATAVWAQAPQSQTPPTQGSAAVAAQGSATAQGTTPAGARPGASGAAQGSATAPEAAGETGVALASGSSVNALLVKPVDSKRSKPGDPVRARTTQPARTEDGTTIPAGSELTGHIAEVPAGAGAAAGSSVAVVFDRAVMKGGREVRLRNVAIRALAAADAAAATSLGDGRASMDASGATGGGLAGGARPALGAGGLVGRAGGAVGGAAGGAAGATGSLGASGIAALQPGPGASGGLDASGLLTSQSIGVFGLRGVSLATGTFASTSGSIVTSGSKRLRLEEGTRLLLSSSASAADQEAREAQRPHPDGDRR